MKTFILSDESVNEYGYRILTNGINLDNFKRNPVMLYAHLRQEATGKPILPIGKWENIRKEGGQLLAEAYFDMNDPFARSIANKVDQGILNAASVHINMLTLSDDPALQWPGQTLSTIIASELIEVSIADIPGNKNAVRLYSHNRLVSEKELALALASGGSEFEKLWKEKGDRLEKLKASNPAKYQMLLVEFKARHSSRKWW
jgi:hypothetical protein